MTEQFRTVRLENGLVVNFFDFSNRYYGNFHRVCIEVKIEIPIQQEQLSPDLAAAVAKLSCPLCFERRLERMGVAGDDLPKVKGQLMEDFLTSSSSYLNKPEFARQFILKKLSEKPKRNFLRD